MPAGLKCPFENCYLESRHMATILVVDDEKDTVALLRYMLEKDGHKVLEAYDGEGALIAVGLDPAGGENEAPPVLPDIILLDVMMPKMDGYSVYARLQQSARTQNIPVVVLTAKGKMCGVFPERHGHHGLPGEASPSSSAARQGYRRQEDRAARSPNHYGRRMGRAWVRPKARRETAERSPSMLRARPSRLSASSPHDLVDDASGAGCVPRFLKAPQQFRQGHPPTATKSSMPSWRPRQGGMPRRS